MRTGKMMEEVSITVAYDAHVINQICDEDIFASLVANSKPKPAVGKMHDHAKTSKCITELLMLLYISQASRDWGLCCDSDLTVLFIEKK